MESGFKKKEYSIEDTIECLQIAFNFFIIFWRLQAYLGCLITIVIPLIIVLSFLTSRFLRRFSRRTSTTALVAAVNAMNGHAFNDDKLKLKVK